MPRRRRRGRSGDIAPRLGRPRVRSPPARGATACVSTDDGRRHWGDLAADTSTVAYCCWRSTRLTTGPLAYVSGVRWIDRSVDGRGSQRERALQKGILFLHEQSDWSDGLRATSRFKVQCVLDTIAMDISVICECLRLLTESFDISPAEIRWQDSLWRLVIQSDGDSRNAIAFHQ